MDCDVTPGGIAIDIDTVGVPQLFTETCTGVDTKIQESAALPDPTAWHFIRVVQEGALVKTCVDGVQLTELAVAVGGANPTSYNMTIGRHAVYSPQFSYFDGKMDEVRVFKGVALPCD
jgi:hypothetical protein